MRLKKFLIFGLSFFYLATPSAALAATLSLTPSSGTFNKGCNVTLDIMLDTTGSSTDGSDAYLIYDTSKFTANSITNGTTYSEYSGNNIDSQAGKIYISGIASETQPFSGQGKLASVLMTVKTTATTGLTQVKFDFDPNNKTKTSDSNVVEHNASTVVDVLDSVTDGSYTIGTGTNCLAVGASPSPQQGRGSTGVATGSDTLDDLVDATGQGPGTNELTYTIGIIGTVLTILGILGFVLL